MAEKFDPTVEVPEQSAYPAMTQSQAATNVIVVQQQQQQQYNTPKTWSSGLCGCFDDCSSCMMGLFCPMVLACSLAIQQNESCCVPYAVPGGVIAMRTKLRVLNNIEGSICGDCCSFYCCYQLTLCQMQRELKHAGTISRQ